MANESKIAPFPGKISPQVRLAQVSEHMDELEGIVMVMKWKKPNSEPSWSTSWSSMKMSDLAMALLVMQNEIAGSLEGSFNPDVSTFGVDPEDDPPSVA